MEPALRIGVTGHRVLGDVAAVRTRVDRVLDRLLGDSTAAVAISPLADGADRLVARAVLDRPGGALEVLLPLPVADYLDDFAAPSAAYERVGQAVVEGCDVLLALWDGAPSGGRGGTAEIVHYARRRGVSVEVIAVRRGGS
jgi:hypothetical protein